MKIKDNSILESKEKNFEFILIAIVIAVFVLSYIESLQNILKYPRYIIMLFSALLLVFNNRHRLILQSQSIRMILRLLIFISVVFPIIQLNFTTVDYNLSIQYSILLIIFIMYIFSVSIVILKEEDVYRYLKTVVISIFLVSVSYVVANINKNGLFGFDIRKVLLNEDRIRNNLGFSHVNTLGMLCYLGLTFSIFLIITNVNKKSIFGWIITAGFFLLLLVNAASRTAIIGTFLTLILYLLFYKVNINKKYILIPFVILIIILFYIIDQNSRDSILQNTNRYGWVFFNIENLAKLDALIGGIGLINHLSIYDMNIGFGFIDNWYIYIFITQGLIGISIYLLVITILMRILKIENNQLSSFIKALLIVQLIYSLFEVYFFVPGVLASSTIFPLYIRQLNFLEE